MNIYTINVMEIWIQECQELLNLMINYLKLQHFNLNNFNNHYILLMKKKICNRKAINNIKNCKNLQVKKIKNKLQKKNGI